MVDGATRRQVSRPRVRWLIAVVVLTALVAAAGLLGKAGPQGTSGDADLRQHVSYPNTRSLVLPLLPRP